MKLLFQKDFKPYWVIYPAFIIALILTATMAVISEFDRHPDEIHHFPAARYYINHLLPPEIGDPAVRDSYSVYGVSYLNYHWAEYFFAGKFAYLASFFTSNQLYAARFFNVFLFLFLIIWFCYRARSDGLEELIIPAFLVVTPQVWYIFSYVNNDAFALFIAILAVYQIGYQKSLLNKFLRAESFSQELKGGLWFGFLLGLLLTAKTNYYAFLVFAALWLFYNVPIFKLSSLSPKISFNFNLIKKYAFIILFALAVLGARCGMDFYVSGETNFVALSYLNYFAGNFEEKKSRLLEYQEEIAEPSYKPSTVEKDLMSTPPSLKLKEKGTSYAEIFTVWRWHEISFASFVGLYGYMNIWTGRWYYRAMAFVYAAFVVYLFGAIIFSRSRDALVQMLIVTIGSLITIFISSYLSWSYAFQAQGRYLFPIIPMFALLAYANRQYLHKLLTNAFIIIAFLLSVYSFIFVALAQINPK